MNGLCNSILECFVIFLVFGVGLIGGEVIEDWGVLCDFDCEKVKEIIVVEYYLYGFKGLVLSVSSMEFLVF